MSEQKIIRVFARKTKMTPSDDLAFFDGPPLYDLPNLPVYVSVTFTWDAMTGFLIYEMWSKSKRFTEVKIGGPALEGSQLNNGNFVPGRFLKEGITITSRGCPKRCPRCLVPRREGRLREINIAPGHIVQDNNLLACSRGHIEAVFDMLRRQNKGAQFKGGLDIDYLEPWHIDLLKTIKVGELWVACDRQQDLKRLDKARDLFSDYSLNKKRCYVLVGYDGDTQQQAQLRCEAVLRKGFLPFAQLYRSETSELSRGDWRNFCWFWSKPRYYKKKLAHLINHKWSIENSKSDLAPAAAERSK